MTDSKISLLKLNFKTNIRGHTNHKPYSILNSDKNIPDKLVKENINLPKNCLFFSDLIPFSKKDYSKNYQSLLKSLVDISEFIRIFKNKIKNEYEDEKISRKEAMENKVYENNLLLILKLIFKPGAPFYFSKDENPNTVIKLKEAIKPVYEGKIISWKNNKYRLYEYNIFVKLLNKPPSEVSSAELKKSNCEDTKYTLDAISYKLLSQYSPTDQLKDHYGNKYTKHLNNGEKILDEKYTPKIYSKSGGKNKKLKKTRKTKKSKKVKNKKTRSKKHKNT